MGNHDYKLKEMLRAIEQECFYTRGLTGRERFSPRVMEAMASVPREEFVPPELVPYAYDNTPLPIDGGQTISQPFIVALMTDLLDPEPEDVILEIGAGSGYQAAVLSQLVKKIHTVEIIPQLARGAAERLQRLGYDNVEVTLGDGYQGLPQHAPYDGIIVTAAAPHIPEPLVNQLKPGAKLVIPVGRPHSPQQLVVVSKDQNGSVEERPVLAVSFVPFTGEGQRQRTRDFSE